MKERDLIKQMGRDTYEAKRREILDRLDPDLAEKARGASLQNLRALEKQLAQRAVSRTEEDERRAEQFHTREAVIKHLRDNLEPRGAKLSVTSEGGIGAVTDTLLQTRKLASVVCPDFETEQFGRVRTFVSGGRLQEGIGLTGEKLLRGVPFLDRLSQLVGGIEVDIFYHAAAEKTISDSQENVSVVRRSAARMERELSNRNHNFDWQVDVIDEPGFFEAVGRRAGEMAPDLDDLQVAALNRDREKIIMMRTGLGRWDITDGVQRHEAAIDIAAHELTETHIQQRIGNEFVHLSVDSLRFAKFYSLPVIALRGGFRYEGD